MFGKNIFEDKVKLDSQVTEIKWNDDCVCATVNGIDQYCGEYAIMTFSIGVLQDAINTKTGVTFSPELPRKKKDAILDVPMVYYARIYLIFDEITFLNKTDDYQQVIGYVSNVRGYYPVYIHDKHHPNVLTVDVTGDLVLRVEKQEPNKTQAEIMGILREMYGNIPDPLQIVVSNWSVDPFFRGVWTAFDVGTPLDIIDELLSPVGRLYFAGESLNKSHYGYTHGAYGSGAYVAKEIISEINGKLILQLFHYFYFTCRFTRSHKSSCMWDACICCFAGWAV